MQTPALVVPTPGAPFKYTHLTLTLPPLPHELHIRVSATGICHTDLIFSREDKLPDMFPCVMGHEGAGTVISVGDAVPESSGLRVGDRVICVFSCCGRCGYCRRGETGYCDRWFDLNFGVGRGGGSGSGSGSGSSGDGGQGSEGKDGDNKVFRDKTGKEVTGHFFGQSSFARDIVVSWRGVVKVPERFKHVSWERLAALACGVMTGAGAMVNVVGKGLREYSTTNTTITAGFEGDGEGEDDHMDNNICVVGTGSVGLSAIMAAKLLPASKRPRRIIAVDIHPSRLELARSYGATHGVNSKAPKNKTLMTTLLSITDGRGIDASVDTTGLPSILLDLVHSSARKGKIVTIGTGGTKAEVTLNLFEMVQAGASYVGCQQGDAYPQEFLPMLLAANEEGKFPYEKLITTYPVKEFKRAMEDMEAGKVVKPVLLWD